MRFLTPGPLAATNTLTALAALAALLAPRALTAQEIRGRLIEEGSEAAIAAAAITLLDDAGDDLHSTVTDSAGLFLLHAPASGRYSLRAERLGYESAVGGPFAMSDRDTIQVELRIAVDAIPLDPLVVIAQAKVPYLHNVGFYQRRGSGFGYFLTRDQIRRRRPPSLTDLLRLIPGVRIVGSPPYADVSLRGSRCTPQILLDGIIARRGGGANDISIDIFAIPVDIEGIEVYRGASEMPPQFTGRTSGCGVIAIWTRDPSVP